MKPASFDYLRPGTLAEALEAKAQHGEAARFLAGGQSLVPAMNFRMAQPRVLIDLNGLTELSGVEITETHVWIGAMTRYRTLERDADLLHRYPLLADALPLISHPQIRSRGTMGGNMAHADPASEMPAVLMALGAEIVASSCAGERRIAAEDFVTGPLSTALGPDEMMTAVELSLWPAGSGMAFQEIARRRGDFAIAGVAVALTIAEGRVQRLRVALCGVGDRALLAAQTQEVIGSVLDETKVHDLSARIAAALQPAGSLQASADYQRHVAQVLCERTLHAAHTRARSVAEIAA